MRTLVPALRDAALGKPLEFHSNNLMGTSGLAYAEAVERMPGFEAQARHAAFLARQGRREEAKAHLADMDKRLGKLHGQFRREARAWRDLAARALG